MRAFFLPAVVAVATLTAGQQIQAEPAGVGVSFVETFQRGEAYTPVTAVGLKPTASPRAAAATDVLVLVDTSASQAGAFRTAATEALRGLLETARSTDRFLLAAVDVNCLPLQDRFEPAASPALATALTTLSHRAPLGSTDIVTVLDAAAELFSASTAPRSIIYIGDGPGLAGADTAEFRRVLTILRTKRISFTALGIGPDVNWQCLAAIANATGGMLLVPEKTIAPADSGSRIGALAVVPVLWPEDALLSTDIPDARLRMLPGRLPPLRSDRDSVLLVEGPLHEARLEFMLEDAAEGHPTEIKQFQLALEIPAAEPHSDNAFIEELFRNARESDGIYLPLLGREGLDIAKNYIRSEAATLAALARQAESAGAHESAMRLAFASLRRDPDNADASTMFTVAQRNVPKMALLPACRRGMLRNFPAWPLKPRRCQSAPAARSASCLATPCPMESIHAA